MLSSTPDMGSILSDQSRTPTSTPELPFKSDTVPVWCVCITAGLCSETTSAEMSVQIYTGELLRDAYLLRHSVPDQMVFFKHDVMLGPLSVKTHPQPPLLDRIARIQLVYTHEANH